MIKNDKHARDSFRRKASYRQLGMSIRATADMLAWVNLPLVQKGGILAPAVQLYSYAEGASMLRLQAGTTGEGAQVVKYAIKILAKTHRLVGEVRYKALAKVDVDASHIELDKKWLAPKT